MKLNQRGVVVILVTMATVAGCGSTHEPVIEDYLSATLVREIGTMASVASRRLTVVRLNDSKGGVEDSRWARGEFCSEPPPDAMVAVAEQWTAEAGGTERCGSRCGTCAVGGFEHGPLVHRTQGLQWNRDSMAFACMDYMIRRVGKDKYMEWIEDIREKSVKLILEELPKLPEVTVNFGTVRHHAWRRKHPPNEP